MANLSAASRRNSAASSAASSPRPSLSAARAALSLDESRIDEVDEKNRGRMCSERSDSGISDCSAVTSASTPLHPCDSITEEDLPPSPDRRSSVEMGTRVDDIRKKFASLSQNIYEMDKQLESVGKKLGDIGQIKICPKKVEVTRIPSLKDATCPTLMQPTASSQSKAKVKAPMSPTAPRSPTPVRSPKLTVPRSPELKTKSRSRDHTPPKPSSNGTSRTITNPSVCTVRGAKAGGLTVSPGAAAKRADFLRLQQVFASNAASKTAQRGDVRSGASTGETPRTRTSPTFHKTVAFWKR